MRGEWRESAEVRLEGYHRDRTSFGAFEDALLIVWSLVVIAFLLVKALFQAVLWLVGYRTRPVSPPKHRRAPEEPAKHRKTPQEGKDEYDRDIWRYGY